MKRGLLLALLLLCAMGSHAAERITIGMQLEPPILDPTASPADGSVLPKLASSWDISDDGLAYTFHLEHGVRFHDGSAFDAAVVKFSLDRARAPESVNPQKSRLRLTNSLRRGV
jgi:peptide/nickel transport system substrate-binding protein